MFKNVLNKPLKTLTFDIEEQPLKSVKETLTQMSSYEICESFKKTYYEEYLLKAASGYTHVCHYLYIFRSCRSLLHEYFQL